MYKRQVYINLNKREDRRKLIQGEMRAQGLKGRRFPAKMGDDVPDSWVTRTWHSKLNCLYDKKTVAAEHKMSKGERGCSGSHIALWKQCAKRDDPSKPMLILEDDAVLWDRSGVYFPELCHRLIAAVEQTWDVVNEPVVLYVGCEVRRPRFFFRARALFPPPVRARQKPRSKADAASTLGRTRLSHPLSCLFPVLRSSRGATPVGSLSRALQ